MPRVRTAAGCACGSQKSEFFPASYGARPRRGSRPSPEGSVPVTTTPPDSTNGAGHPKRPVRIRPGREGQRGG